MPAVNWWRIRIPVPVAAHGWLTSNNHEERYGQAKRVRAYRKAAADAGRRAGLPMGVSGVYLHYRCVYVTPKSPVRDRLNLEPTIKALTDGLGPERGWLRQGRRQWSPGCGFLVDDSDRHVLGTSWDLQREPDALPYVVLTISRTEIGPQ